VDIASAIDERVKQEEVGIRPGEKLHEQMIGTEDAPYTYEYDWYYKILPSIYNWGSDPKRVSSGIKVKDNFMYCSNSNQEWMSPSHLKEWISKNKDKIGNI